MPRPDGPTAIVAIDGAPNMNGDLFKRLNPAEPLTAEEKDLFAWLRKNRENFQTEHKYDAWEIAKFAMMNGFSETIVFKHISSIIAVQNGQRIENVAAQKEYALDVAVEMRQKAFEKLEYVRESDLLRSWKHLRSYQLKGLEFSEVA